MSCRLQLRFICDERVDFSSSHLHLHLAMLNPGQRWIFKRLASILQEGLPYSVKSSFTFQRLIPLMRKKDRQILTFTDAQRTDKTEENSYIWVCVVSTVFGDETRQEWRQERGISPQTLSITWKSHWWRQNPSQEKFCCCHMTYILLKKLNKIILIRIDFCESRNPVQWHTNHLLADRRTVFTEEFHGIWYQLTFVIFAIILSLIAPRVIIKFTLLLLLLLCWNVNQSSKFFHIGFKQAII